MPTTLHISSTLLIYAIIAAIFVIAYPLILGVIAHKKLAVGWKYFWFGTLVFLVFQLLTRLPLVTTLQNTVFASALRTSTTFFWIWLVILALTAGLFEEVGRYVGYRLFMRRESKTWSKAIMFGLGHEGLESIVLVGGRIALTLLSIALLSAINLNGLPVAQRQNYMQQIATINAVPIWLPLQAIWERLWSIPMQVSLSVLVLQVFRRNQMRWLLLAILFHALIDFTTSGLPQLLSRSIAIRLFSEGMFFVFGFIGIWIIWHLRESGGQTHRGEEGTKNPTATRGLSTTEKSTGIVTRKGI